MDLGEGSQPEKREVLLVQEATNARRREAPSAVIFLPFLHACMALRCVRWGVPDFVHCYGPGWSANYFVSTKYIHIHQQKQREAAYSIIYLLSIDAPMYVCVYFVQLW